MQSILSKVTRAHSTRAKMTKTEILQQLKQQQSSLLDYRVHPDVKALIKHLI